MAASWWRSVAIVTCVVLACALALHVAHAMRPCRELKILQVGTDGLVPDVLARRCPIVVEAPFCAPGAPPSVAASLLCVARKVQQAGLFCGAPARVVELPPGAYACASESVVLACGAQVPAERACTIRLTLPGKAAVASGSARGVVALGAADPEAPFVELRLYSDNVLVLPYGWRFETDEPVDATHVDSAASRCAAWLRR